MGHMILRKSVEGQPGDSGAILGKGTLGKLPQYLGLATMMKKLLSHCHMYRSCCICQFNADSVAVLVLIVN